jgi:DNA replication protein DnaC
MRDRLIEIPERFREATFENYSPRNQSQERALSLMREDPEDSYFLFGPYDCGKTHLLHAQYRRLALAGVPCNVRTTVDLLNEIQRMECDQDFLSPVFAQVRTRSHYHLFWDDADKFKITDFRSQALHELIDLIYRNCLNLTITSNYLLKELGDLEKLPPSVLRRMDGMCRVLEM